MAFMRSGGYSVSKDIPQLGEQTIIFWGANDEILDKESVKRFAVDLPRSRYSTSCSSPKDFAPRAMLGSW